MSFFPSLKPLNFDGNKVPFIFSESSRLDAKYYKEMKNILGKRVICVENLCDQVITRNKVNHFYQTNSKLKNTSVNLELVKIICDNYLISKKNKIAQMMFEYNSVYQCAFHTLMRDNAIDEEFKPKLITNNEDKDKFYNYIVSKSNIVNTLQKNEKGTYLDVMILVYYIGNHSLILKDDYIDNLLKIIQSKNSFYREYACYELALELVELIFFN